MQWDITMLKKKDYLQRNRTHGCVLYKPLLLLKPYSPGALEPEREVPMLPAIVDEIS